VVSLPTSATRIEGYSERTIFSYTLSHLPQSRKVVFFYALKGRYGKDGILKRCNVQQLAKGALIVPREHSAEFEAFLKKWECSYLKREAFVAA